ncbi:MAG: acyltransferase [Vicinamibacterales bacterium]
MKAVGRSNLADIDVFRGLAALVVAAMHTREVTWVGLRQFSALNNSQVTPGSLAGYVTLPLVWGSIGVPIFFVLSGYCIHRSQAFARASCGEFQLSTGNFLLRRFFRIYPVIAGALLLTLICDWASGHYYPTSVKLGDTSPLTFLVNLFSLQGLAGPTYGSNLPLWTLSVEVQFYLLYPVLLVMMARLGNLPTFLLLALLNAASYFVLQAHGYVLFSSFYISWYLGALVAEGEAARMFAHRLSSPGVRAGVYALSLAGLGLGCIVFFRNQYVAFQIWAFAFAAFLFAVVNLAQPVWGWFAGFFRWLGSFSFSLYIIHVPVVVLIHSVLFHSVNQVSIVPFYATLVAVVGCAYAFFWLFERPALILSKRSKRQPSCG